MLYNIPMKNRYTAVRVWGVTWCAKIKYRTRTRDTRDTNTTGFSVPVQYPNLRYNTAIWDSEVLLHLGVLQGRQWDLRMKCDDLLVLDNKWWRDVIVLLSIPVLPVFLVIVLIRCPHCLHLSASPTPFMVIPTDGSVWSCQVAWRLLHSFGMAVGGDVSPHIRGGGGGGGGGGKAAVMWRWWWQCCRCRLH